MSARPLLLQVSLASLVLLLLAGSATPARATTWDRESRACMARFEHLDQAEIDALAYCMRVWATFRKPNEVTEAEKAKAVPAFQKVYREGDDQIRYEAKLVLQSLSAAIPRIEAGAGRPAGEDKARAEPKRVRFQPRPCSRSAEKKARSLNKKGYKLARKGKDRKARALYGKAVRTCESYVLATYNYAAASAKLGQGSEAKDYLQRLVDMGDDAALAKVHHARLDDDFTSLHDDAAFKRVTGFVKLKLLNSIGEYGEEEVERIEKTLKKLQHRPAEIAADKHRRKRPYIWYKRHAAAQAELFKEVVDHPDTQVRPITWETDYDVIISWGVKLIKDEYGDIRPAQVAHEADPDEVDKKLNSMQHKQNGILRQPNNAANKANRALGTPTRTKNAATSAVKRTEKTIKKYQDVGKKLGL